MSGRRAARPSAERAAAIERIWSAMSDLVLAQDRRRAVSEELGLSFFRTKILRRLVDGPSTMRDLAAQLIADRPYLSVAVDDLEQRGLLERTVHLDDRRVRLLTLTDAGMRVARRANEILARPPRGFDALSKEDVETLERLLGLLARDDGISPE